MKKIVFSVFGLFWCMSMFAAPDSLVVKQLERVAEKLTLPEVAVGEVKIRLPEVPEGYRLELKGTDKLPVVDAVGNIGKALTEQEVTLYCVLTDVASGVTKEVTGLKVKVAGERVASKDANACPAVIPALREWVGGDGKFTFPISGRIVFNPQYERELKAGALVLADDLKALDGRSYSVAAGKPMKGDVYLTLGTTDEQLGEEGYRMVIEDGVHIEAVAARGAFWGTRTLLQIVQQQGDELVRGTVRDYPKYSRRGFTLDVARKYISLDFVKAYMKIMSYYKMNDFHVHLNDNGFVQFFDNDWDKTYAAFRLESDWFPGLTAKDGFYTKAEFRDFQKEAVVYGVNVVPEIDVPAHSLAFSHYRKSLGSEKYGMDHLDILNPATYTFIDSLFREYLEGPDPVFVGPEVHIGTDEYSKEVAEEFRAFTDHYLGFVQGFGKRARMWGALTHAQGKTPVRSQNVIMNAWYNGYADPKVMIEQGYDLVSTPDGFLYIVPAAGYYYDYLNTKFLYEKWEPIMIGNQVFPFGHPKVLGGTFAVWNDHSGNGITEKDIHHRAFPAMQVLAEKMWTGERAGNDYEQFAAIAAGMIEAPGLNLMGKVASKGDLVINYKFLGGRVADFSGNGYDVVRMSGVKVNNDGFVFDGKGVVELPVREIGYDYTVRFDLLVEKGNAKNAILFRSPDAVVFFDGDNGGKLSFSREGYTYCFDFVPEFGKWMNLAIQGDNKGTALYVDGLPVQDLRGKTKVVKNKNGRESTMHIQQTLIFPLQQIGDETNGFKGRMKELEVFNRKLQAK